MSNGSIIKRRGYHQDRHNDYFAMYANPTLWHGYSMENGLQKSHIDSLTSKVKNSWSATEELPDQTYIAQRDI